jgi:lipid-A-disaccharide synthase
VTPKPLIYLVAGEPSGDALGGRLMTALRRRLSDQVNFAGVGGEHMQAEGLKSLFPMEELSVMGIVEILPHARALFQRMSQVAGDIDRLSPDAVVTIDAPAFAHGVAKRIRQREIPRIHYVAPQLWAWRPWRVHKFRRAFNHVLALLPFEPEWFESRGVSCRFVGHPVIESGADNGDGVSFRTQHEIAPDAKVICCLLGSRRGEVQRHVVPFRTAIENVAKATPGLVCVLPTVQNLIDEVHAFAEGLPCRSIVVAGGDDKYDAMAASNVALAASGTVTLELSMAGVPTVVAYRMAFLTYVLGKPLINVDYANLINLILDRPVIPEFLQTQCTGENLSHALTKLLGSEGNEQRSLVKSGLKALGLEGASPSDRAAEAVLEIIAQSKK